MRGEIIGFFIDFVSCFPLFFFRAVPLPACFTTEQGTVEASLFVKQLLNSVFHDILNNQSLGISLSLLPTSAFVLA